MKDTKKEILTTIEDIQERFAIMVYDGNISKKIARAYILNHAENSILKFKAIQMQEFYEDEKK